MSLGPAQRIGPVIGVVNQAGRTFSQGEINYDSKVNALDFNAIATTFGISIPAPPLDAADPSLFSAPPRPDLFGAALITDEDPLIP